MVENGHWLLPEDMLGRPATKPPMYNWLDAPVVAAGWHSEFALKLPSTLAALVVLVFTWCLAYGVARDVMRGGGGFQMVDIPCAEYIPCAAASVACICLVANPMFLKLAYTARPDMVLTAFLVCGWFAAMQLLRTSQADVEGIGAVCRDRPRHLFLWQALLWLSVAGAALTKGPPALLLPIYLVVGVILLGGGWSLLRRTGIVWGLAFSIGLFGLWTYAVYTRNPEHFNAVFLGEETLGRISRGGPLRVVMELWKMPAWLVGRFAPWSVFMLLAVWHLFSIRPVGRWRHRPIGACVLWLIVVVAFFSLSGGKRPDYLAPALPAVAVLASQWLVFEGHRAWGMRSRHAAAAGLLFAMLLAAYQFVGSAAAREDYGEHILTFTREVQRLTHEEGILFEDTEYTPLQSLLGYNQPVYDPGRVSEAHWVVKPVAGPGYMAVSKPVWVGGDLVEVRMALYPLD